MNLLQKNKTKRKHILPAQSLDHRVENRMKQFKTQILKKENVTI